MTRLVLYVAAPLRPTEAEIDACEAVYGGRYRAAATADALKSNLERAMRWLSWLRRSFPEVTFVAPWIASLLAGEDDAIPAQREAGLVDADAIVPLLDGVVLCGGRISAGMGREESHARQSWDLTSLGVDPPDAAFGHGQRFVEVFRAYWVRAAAAPPARGPQDASNRRNDAGARVPAPASPAPPPKCERLAALSGPGGCTADAEWYYHYDYVSSPTLSEGEIVPGERCIGRTALCDEHRRQSRHGHEESKWTRIEPDAPSCADRERAASELELASPPKPCARRLGSTWCTRTDLHAESECSGQPGREIAATESGPGGRR